MKNVGVILFLLFTGPGLLTLGIKSLRHGRWRESIPLLEVMIGRVAGIEPPPRTCWDRGFARAQAWIFVLFGSFFSFCLAAVVFTLFVPE